MAVLFIRKPSETPNIQNIDDIRMVRYAYGNQNGYIKGYGAELSHNITGSTFIINSGIFVVQGAEVKVDANGWSESVSGVTNKRYYTVYGEVNLALQTAEIKSKYSHATYPTIDAGDDLTQSTDGTARVELYRFTATNGVIADVKKVIKEIPYSIDMINQLINGIKSGEVKAKIAEYASDDTSKGTIEERLTSLGFRQGNIEDSAGNIIGTVKRQGNYVICQGNGYKIGTDVLYATIPVGFRPAKQEEIGVSCEFKVKALAGIGSILVQGGPYGRALPDGLLVIYMERPSTEGLYFSYTDIRFYGGWEAAPIE